MFLQQFCVESLGHYSYLIGSDEAKTGFVVDPKRDVQDYLDAARMQQLRITHIFETHLHNDYVSGARELAAATGARIHSSALAESGFNRVAIEEGDEFRFGELLLRVLETPGHTPEHVCYTLADCSRTDEPLLMLTGGDLLVSSVGRPDLLGAELGRELAPKLFDSLHHKILTQRDHVTVLPTHGAGSSCGANISRTRSSTVGYERICNPYLQTNDRDEFVRQILAGQPAIPAYYQRMRPINQQGPNVLGRLPEPVAMEPDGVEEAIAQGGVLIDTRQPSAFGGAHVPGSYSIGLGPNFTTWVGSVVPAGQPLLLLVEDGRQIEDAVHQLIRIGYEDVRGYLSGGIGSWLAAGKPVQHLAQLSVFELHERLTSNGSAPLVLDVRSGTEWQSGHIAGAKHIPGGDLPVRIAELRAEQSTAVICGSGYRSSVAGSILQQHGFQEVANVIGGMTAWQSANLSSTPAVA